MGNRRLHKHSFREWTLHTRKKTISAKVVRTNGPQIQVSIGLHCVISEPLPYKSGEWETVIFICRVNFGLPSYYFSTFLDFWLTWDHYPPSLRRRRHVEKPPDVLVLSARITTQSGTENTESFPPLFHKILQCLSKDTNYQMNVKQQQNEFPYLKSKNTTW